MQVATGLPAFSLSSQISYRKGREGRKEKKSIDFSAMGEIISKVGPRLAGAKFECYSLAPFASVAVKFLAHS